MWRWLLLAFLLGCGARTSLGGPFGDDGAGGNGAAPNVGGGGNGGNPTGPGPGGGGGRPCDEIVVTEPVAHMAADPDMHQRQPALAYASDALDQVTLASEWFAVEGPIEPPSELRHATFAAWNDSWPSEVGPSYLADFDAGVSFAVAESTNNRLALLMSDGDKPQAPHGALFSLDFGPGTGIVPTKYTVDALAQRALFASLQRQAAKHLVGVGHTGVPMSAASYALTELDNGIGLEGPWPLGCGDNALLADAVATDDAWIVVGSSAPGYEASPCLEPGPAGASTLVYVARAEIQGQLTPCTATSGPGVVTRVATAPHPAGAWAVWAFETGHIEAVRVDALGCAVADIFSVADSGQGAFTVGAGHFGDLLVVAFAEGGMLVVRIFDETGALFFETSYGAAVISDPVDVIGSPDGDAFAVAFTSQADVVASTVSVARFECR